MKMPPLTKSRDNTILTRLFIVGIVIVIIAIYYLSEKKPFQYQGYENYLSSLLRYDAELNQALVQTRFGIVQNYDPIDKALKGLVDGLDVLKEELHTAPNPDIDKNLNNLQNVINTKENLSQDFKRINPVLINAINQFSTIMYNIIDQQESSAAVEKGLGQQLEQQYAEQDRYQMSDKINTLFRGILIYINQRNEESHTKLLSLVNDIRKDPLVTDQKSYPKLENALAYADKILELQPKISQIDEVLFKIPIEASITALEQSYHKAFQAYLQKAYVYHIVLYVMLFLLLVVLRWAFNRLRGTVQELHIEVERKIKAEKELEEINRQLEQRVAQRTKELTVKNSDLNQALSDLKEAQDQLIIQEKMASVGMLTTGIAHEIKNPLNFVNNFSDLSVELLGELNEELAHNQDKLGKEVTDNINDIISDLKINCAKIKEHGVRADNIVKNMLLHSQEAGVQKELVDLKVLMDDNIQIALESFRSAQGKFDVQLEKNYEPNLPKVLVAPQSIGRVFIYVVDNALYAMREKQKSAPPTYQPLLQVSMTLKDSNVVIKMKDNGNGIPKKNLDKVFEPFFTTKPTGRGNTGLGLSICYDTVVKQHKGELRVSSEEGEFTEFTITLAANAGKQ